MSGLGLLRTLGYFIACFKDHPGKVVYHIPT